MAISNLLLNEGSGSGTGYKGDFDAPSQAQDIRSRISKMRFIDTALVNLSTDDYKIMRIKQGQTVVDATIIVQTAEAAADTLDVGYYYDDTTASATQFNTNQALNVVGVFQMEEGTDAGHQFLDDGWITITPSAALTAAKFWIEVDIVDTPYGAQNMKIDFDAAD